MTMQEILSTRDQEIDELTNFTAETKKELNEIVTKLGWNEENTELREIPLTCPFNSSHRLPPKSVEKHIENCLWKAEGYSEDDLPLSVPSVPPDAPTCIKLDEQMIENILKYSKPQDSSSTRGSGCRLIPRTSDRLLTDFTPEERRVLYDYVISHTEQPDLGEDIADLNKTQNQDNKTSSYLELLSQERNLKRRRAKHRGVHTNKKSQTEIMREVITQQMEMLSEYLVEKDESNKIELNSEECKRHERNGTNSSREVRRESSRDYHQYSSRKESIDHSKYSKSSRSHDSRERHSHRHSEERKKHKKHERNRSRERDHDHHKHKSKSRKRSRSREDKKSKKRRRCPN